VKNQKNNKNNDKKHPGKKDAASPARAFAADMIRVILKEHCSVHDILESPLAAGYHLSASEHQQALAIVSATFRRMNSLKVTLQSFMDKGLPKDGYIQSLLLSAAAQILLLDYPAHAVVNDSVILAKKHPKTAFAAGMINAVLRKIANISDFKERTSHISDLPPWLQERWINQYGKDITEKISAILRIPAPLDLSFKTVSHQELEAWAEKLEGFILPTNSIRLLHRRPVPTLPGFEQGAWWVQNCAASLPVYMLKPEAGEHILDLCAAPGGKTAQIAASGAKVTAVDSSAKRLRRLEDNMKRLQLQADILCHDVLDLPHKLYDGVLLDAPCSATGTLRRHPEAGWIKDHETIISLADIQKSLLDKAASLVRPGGRLVYATCSLEQEEGENQIHDFLQRHPNFKRKVQTAQSLPVNGIITPEGDMRSLPFYLTAPTGYDETFSGMDGFFASCLIKDSAS